MLSKTLQCERVKLDEIITEPVAFDFNDRLAGLPVLVISTGWRKTFGSYRDVDFYEVEEVPTGWEGRAFLLHRSQDAIEADRKDDGEPDERYGCYIARNKQDHVCECRGFQAHSHCKHVDVLTYLVDGGHIDHPAHDPRPQTVIGQEVPIGFDPFAGETLDEWQGRRNFEHLLSEVLSLELTPLEGETAISINSLPALTDDEIDSLEIPALA